MQTETESWRGFLSYALPVVMAKLKIWNNNWPMRSLFADELTAKGTESSSG